MPQLPEVTVKASQTYYVLTGFVLLILVAKYGKF
jgi:hypothetical protein